MNTWEGGGIKKYIRKINEPGRIYGYMEGSMNTWKDLRIPGRIYENRYLVGSMNTGTWEDLWSARRGCEYT